MGLSHTLHQAPLSQNLCVRACVREGKQSASLSCEQGEEEEEEKDVFRLVALAV